MQEPYKHLVIRHVNEKSQVVEEHDDSNISRIDSSKEKSFVGPFEDLNSMTMACERGSGSKSSWSCKQKSHVILDAKATCVGG